LRVLVLNWRDRENPQAGGAELHLHESFGRLVRAGHTVDLVCSGWPDAPPETTLDGIRVFRCGNRHTHALVAKRRAERLLSAQPYDVVVEDLNKIPLFSPLWADPPVVALFHHLFGATAFQEASLPIASLTWALERPIPRVYRQVPCIAVSESTKEDLVARGLEARIEVIPNGLDHTHFTPDPGVRAERPTILTLGRLKRYKRIELVLEAVALLRGRGLDVEFLIAGSGSAREALEAKAADLNLGNAVRFLGFVTEDEKLRLFRSAWVHVFTSPKEGWGLTNLEAAACGTPTIASDSPGLRESVRHQVTGLLVPHGEVGAIADALQKMIEHEDARTEYGRAAIEFASEFTWERTASALERVLKQASTAKGKGRT